MANMTTPDDCLHGRDKGVAHAIYFANAASVFLPAAPARETKAALAGPVIALAHSARWAAVRTVRDMPFPQPGHRRLDVFVPKATDVCSISFNARASPARTSGGGFCTHAGLAISTP